MTRIGASLGGGVPPRQQVPAGPGRDWRQPQSGQPATDWTDPKYATPQPGPNRHYGGHQLPRNEDVPQLPERNIRVKAVAPATYYTQEGVPIPADSFVTLPISPGLIQAIKDGDLERGEDPADDSPGQQQQPRAQRPDRHQHRREHQQHPTQTQPPKSE